MALLAGAIVAMGVPQMLAVDDAPSVLRAMRQRRGYPSAVFNIPSGSRREQNAIARHIDDLAAATPPGALIRIAIFEFTSPSFARILIDAYRRGVRVQLVVDATTRHTAAYREVARTLGGSRRRSSWAVACEHGCIGDTIMHNKFFLFSRTGAARDVVVQSSANLTATNRLRAWNNAVTISDARIYRAYGRYFAALAARRHRDGYYHMTRSGPVTAYTFPRAGHSSKSDTLAEMLGHVGCADGATVWVTAFLLTRAAVARRLSSLADQGCDVRVIYTKLGDRARRLLLHPGGPHLLSSRYRFSDQVTGRPRQAFVHSKYLLIDGTYAGADRHLVVTGSPNITNSALRHNDEAMLAIDDPDLYEAYEDNFLDLWAAATEHGQLFGNVPGAG